MAILKIYTDGACSGNQNDTNLGGWGAVLEYGDHLKEIHGSEPNTTNNRMELTAPISALSLLKREGLSIWLFSDSSYVINCLSQGWYRKWERNGWINSKKEPVENPELWKELLSLVRKHQMRYFLVKGHVNLQTAKQSTLDSLYQKFLRHNGDDLSYEEFLHATERNNRADALANEGINEIR